MKEDENRIMEENGEKDKQRDLGNQKLPHSVGSPPRENRLKVSPGNKDAQNGQPDGKLEYNNN